VGESQRGAKSLRHMAYFNGAAQEGGSVQGLPEEPQQVSRGLLELQSLCHPSCKVLKTLHCAASCQSLVGSVQPVGTGRAQLGFGEEAFFGCCTVWMGRAGQGGREGGKEGGRP
jgi:hypothetical protein